MNLATAQATKRAREVGVRKSVGAGRGQLALQFFGESVLLSLISLPVAWTIVQLLEPTWNSFIGSTTAINWTTRPAVPAGIGLIAIVIGLISGSYPAAYLSGFQPSLILRGLGSADGTGTVRKGLVILQFGISIVLVISTIVAWNQLTFVMHKDLGFDKENIITLSFFDVNSRLRKDYRDIKSRLASHPDVVNVFASASRPGEGWTRDRRQVESPKNPGMTFELNNYSVDESFFESLGIQLIDGRNFSPERASDYGSAFILNETAVQKLEFDDPIGKPFVWKDAEVAAGYGKATAKQGFIIGVVKDFHTRRLQEQIEPTAFVMEPGRFRIVSVKTRAGTLLSSMDHFENIWNQYITDRPLHYYFLDDRLEYGYRNERRYQQILAVSFGLAIFIACLGLTGLAAYTAERRTKEIGIRKVLGATSASIIALLCSEFVRIIALANLVAWPLAWYTMSAWLKGFAYRIDLTLLPFATAFVLSIAFALTMVGLQAYRAARTDPIDALRYE
jgi:putative ABC transport system permease protein